MDTRLWSDTSENLYGNHHTHNDPNPHSYKKNPVREFTGYPESITDRVPDSVAFHHRIYDANNLDIQRFDIRQLIHDVYISTSLPHEYKPVLDYRDYYHRYHHNRGTLHTRQRFSGHMPFVNPPRHKHSTTYRPAWVEIGPLYSQR
jgi:hypothetical protein